MTNPMESINKTIKPYLRLKTVNKKECNNVILQNEDGITYRFTDGSMFAEFNYDNVGYTHLTNDQCYELDLQNPNYFYTESRLKSIECIFQRKFDVSMTFRTSIFHKSLEEICKNIQKIDCVKLLFNFKQNRIEIREDLDFKFHTYYLVPLWEGYSFDPKNKDSYVLYFNPKYLLLSLSHGYDFSTILVNENGPIIVYGSNTNDKDKSYRSIVMNLYRKTESDNDDKAKKLIKLMENIRNS